MKMDKIKYRSEKAGDGNYTLVVTLNDREMPLHSRRNPLREGQKSSFSLNPEKYDVLVILGFGLGYSFLGEIENFRKFKKIYVVDILSGVETSVKLNAVTEVFCRSGNIQFLTGKEPRSLHDFFKDKLDFSSLRGVQVVEHGASLRLFPEYYHEIRKILLRLINEKSRNAATSRKFGRLFLRNAIFNLLGGGSIVPVSNLFNKFMGGGCLIVSSAPSVEGYLNGIEEFRHRFKIIAVDSALPVLISRRIVPDFVISIDPQRVIGEHLLGQEVNSSFIFSAVSPPAMIKKYRGFLSLNSHPLAQIFDHLSGGGIGSVDSSTGSVAGDALNFAIKAGFHHIAMVGFDFSFSGNKIYSRGTAYQKRYSSIFNSRLQTAETFNANYIFRSSGSLLHNGRYTRRAFLDYRDSLGKLTSSRGELFFINSIPEEYVPENMVLTNLENFVSLIENDEEGFKIESEVRSNLRDSGDIVGQCMELFKNDEFLEEFVVSSLGDEGKEEKMDYVRGLIAGAMGRNYF